MEAWVTTKGQVTIPKALRDKFGIVPGGKVDFVESGDGIHLRKVVDPAAGKKVLGCLKDELAEKTVDAWVNDLRGPVEIPKRQ
jgi:AbrB family looped-hinge helix DNA binding protein